MNRSSRRFRIQAKLSDSVHHQVSMYALVTSAAGVAALASAQPADAKIVYTAAHIRIVQNSSVTIDLNHDGIPDFTISSFCNCTTYAPVAILGVGVERRNQVWGLQSGSRWMGAALKAGVRVGKNSAFKEYSSGLYMAIVSRQGNVGPWAGNKEAYLGLQFKVSGKTHYGWARLRVITQQTEPFIRATLTGYAYETIPNKAIIAGRTKGPDDGSLQQANAVLSLPIRQPASLGALALGSPAVSIWRRDERSAP
ncbi:MAG TPA: hypothetical protein VNZ03_07665 [Terriglobales bacterium]|jgi:hypothetical protein|nr:hypothetical protein [Terriglobales bacterium]